ncbi:MAG: DUF349 domain-containing protein [Bacteroidaceae bacterium]|nr:DUF349 domain-containing protein [Bacteroidaceae bacterium]
MTDTQDTNLPKMEGGLEDVKQTVEAPVEAPVEAIAEAVEPTVEEAAIEEAQVEETAAEAVAEEAQEALETAALDESARKLTKSEILAKMKEIAEDVTKASKAEIDTLKQNFYRLHNSEVEAAKRAFLEGGGNEEDFVPTPDPEEGAFKEVMAVIKEQRSKLNAEEEKEREKNYQVKLAIIEELKELIESPEDPNKNYNEFKKLQQQWHEVTLIPQNKANELWKSYQLYVEKFYDLLKLNNEFREYDFKKNLEIKTRLCEAAEKLVEEEDVVAAFHHLQKLHQEYRDTGPVAKELRDEIWARFKAASTLLNKKHQQYFETQKEAEQDNLDKKTVICEIVEGIDYGKLNGFQAWDKKTQEVIALQNKWKTIGYAPQKLNVKIFERFRSACDEFFKKKSEYFKAAKARMNENLEKKRALVEKAEALKDSKEWKETAEELVKIQKEWKSIGPVAKRYSDTLWKRFIAACDYFFEQKGAATSSQRSIESENLKRKKAIIEELKELLNKEESEENNQQIHKLMAEWNEVGHVPFKEKDKVYEQYRAMVDKLYKTFNLSMASKKVSKFRTAVSKVQETGIQAVYREREKLVRNYENLLNELHTYENNLGFLNATSKSGNSLLTELTKKMDKLKAEIEVAKEKIRHIDEDIQQEDEKAE